MADEQRSAWSHILSFLTLEELCHLACVAHTLHDVVYDEAGHRWESALTALLQANCNNACIGCGDWLVIECKCEDGEKYMKKYAAGTDESLAFAFKDPRLNARAFCEMTPQARVSRLLSFHQASVRRLRDDPQFSLFSDDWTCEPPDVHSGWDSSNIQHVG